jgi:hypothetical protein
VGLPIRSATPRLIRTAWNGHRIHARTRALWSPCCTSAVWIPGRSSKRAPNSAKAGWRCCPSAVRRRSYRRTSPPTVLGHRPGYRLLPPEHRGSLCSSRQTPTRPLPGCCTSLALHRSWPSRCRTPSPPGTHLPQDTHRSSYHPPVLTAVVAASAARAMDQPITV